VPDLAQLNAWAEDARLALPCGSSLRFAEAAPGGALAYEQAVARDGIVGVRRNSLHDALNALVWLAFPRMKAALNARHVRDGAGAAPNARSRARDAATLLDESGLVLVCADSDLVRLLRDHAWRELFCARHAEVTRATCPFAVGHGLLAKLRAPYRAITAKTLIVALDPATLPAGGVGRAIVDAAAARAIAGPAFRPEWLLPLPVSALPGWDTEGLGERLFEDPAVFRPPALSPTRSDRA